MEPNTLKFKKDRFRKARGGYSRFLNIYCSSCGNHLIIYQKDGPGPLKRAYLDRIFAPLAWSDQHNKEIKLVKPLKCQKCGLLIGKPYIYDKENRPAYLLEQTAFVKKIGKGVYPPLIENFKSSGI